MKERSRRRRKTRGGPSLWWIWWVRNCASCFERGDGRLTLLYIQGEIEWVSVSGWILATGLVRIGQEGTGAVALLSVGQLTVGPPERGVSCWFMMDFDAYAPNGRA